MLQVMGNYKWGYGLYVRVSDSGLSVQGYLQVRCCELGGLGVWGHHKS